MIKAQRNNDAMPTGLGLSFHKHKLESGRVCILFASARALMRAGASECAHLLARVCAYWHAGVFARAGGGGVRGWDGAGGGGGGGCTMRWG